ncbi:NAD(P)-dependent oxidoreductase [Halorientalis brevis]|uniref:NAD(P)-dependent oxidoreductase n=1 Tax=Halorientalis brevis TaxID=1126241 RepID=A0ABD6CBH5_9EURY|nr:NAD(P)-dependent oxidoreductase [Halorientalis brevis]
MDRIGFVGLGAMGEPMAWNVHGADYDLHVHNRTAAAMSPFAAEGVATHDTPADLAAAVDAVVVMVTGPDALRAVVTGDEGVIEGLDPGTAVVNTSTVSREATEEVASTVEGTGGRFVDAPVLGTVGPAEAGELLVLAGASDDVLADVRPLLSVFGDVRHVGDVGEGTSTKLTTNLLLGVMMEGFSEALAFAEGQGLDTDEVLDVIQNGVLGAPLYDYKGPVVSERDFTPQFPVDLLFKDLNLVLDAAGEDGTPLPAVGATREATSATRALGHGEEDMMALVKHLEAVTGRTVGSSD